jgi:hypothetical protein
MRTVDELRIRRAAGDLTDAEYGAALDRATAQPGAAAWSSFVERTAAALGTASIVAGAIYLVAGNWAGLGRCTKLAIAAGAVVGATALASVLGLDRLPGKLAAAASCGLAGALFVLYTQVYQVGADPWELFAAFAVICAPYAWASRLPAVGAAGLVSAQLAALLGYAQLHPGELAGWAWFSAGWVAVHIAALAVLQRFWSAGAAPRALALLGVAVPTALAIGEIFDGHDQTVALGAFAAMVAGVHLTRRDLFPVAWAVVGAAVVAASWAGREVWPDLHEQTWLLLAVLVTVLGAAAAAWLRFLHRSNA